MKRIRKFAGPLPGIGDYRERAGEDANWRGYRRDPARYRNLANALANLQHGLCGYCEVDLRDDDRQVEHVVPRSHPREGAKRALDAANLIACCRGGEASDAGAQDDDGRLPPVSRSRSCGQAKGGDTDPDFIDPRALPALPSLMRVRTDGRIEVDAQACAACGVAEGRVSRTIEILGLNVERLQRARQRYRDRLDKDWSAHFSDPAAMERWARLHLLPGRNGELRRFFTTSRSYFAELGESILSGYPREWI